MNRNLKKILSQYFRLSACGLLLLILGGCNSEPKNFGSGTYRLPWLNEKGRYELRPIEIKTLSNTSPIEGPAADIKIRPGIQGRQMTGNSIFARLSEANGVRMALDLETLHALTVYAHFERLREMDQLFGADDLKWPRTIGLQSAFLTQDGQILFNNAAYIGLLDAVAIVPYQRPEGLTPVVNGGILAHEHFHAHFFHRVIQDLGSAGVHPELLQEALPAHATGDTFRSHSLFLESPSPEKNAAEAFQAADFYGVYVLRAWNEGLADYWNWLYQGEEFFISVSLGQREGELRKIGPEVVPTFPSERFFNVIKSSVTSESRREIYKAVYNQIGNPIARLMRALTEIRGRTPEGRLAFQQSFVEALKGIGPTYLEQQSSSKDIFSVGLFLEPLEKALGEFTEEECEKINEFLRYEPLKPNLQGCD